MPSIPAATANQSTDKALAIIELLSYSGQPLRLNEISSRLGFNNSTALRFLNSLESNGYIYKNPDTGRYSMTFKLCSLASYISSSTDMIGIASPPIRELSYDLGECVCLTISQDYSVVYVFVSDGPNHILQSTKRIGRVAPMHCTASGKVMLTDFTEVQIDEMIARKGLTKFTEHTITAKEQLLKELDEIRVKGFACDDEECDLGTRCIAFPIRDYTGHIVASLSVTGASGRMTDEYFAAHMNRIRQTAASISERFGYRAPN